jgi:hypothetical protein
MPDTNPTGIGRLCDLMIEALATGNASKMQPRKDEKTGGKKTLWDFESRGHKTAEPAPRGPRPVGSGNYGPVANLCWLVVSEGRDQRAAGWLRSFYVRQGPEGDLGHHLFEPLSYVYGDVHIVSALLTIAAAKEWDLALSLGEAADHANRMLARELALCLLHRTPGGRIIHAGTRSKAPKAGERSVARETFVRLALTGRAGNQKPGRIEQAFKLAGWSAPISLFDAGKNAGWGAAPWDGPIHAADLQPYLGEIRLASGPLVVTHFENGHVSRFETGPVCYQSPLPLAVVRYEPFEAWPVLLAGKGGTKENPGRRNLRTMGDRGGAWVFWEELGKEHSDRVEEDLGAVVAEHRVEGIKL